MDAPKLTLVQELRGEQRHVREAGREAGKGRKPNVGGRVQERHLGLS